MTNRKLKRNVVFDKQETYNKYQIPVIKRLSKGEMLSFCNWMVVVHGWSSLEVQEYRNDHDNKFDCKASIKYATKGLAKAFEKKHKPHNKENEITISEMGQKIN
jgi:hypothetical protein